MKLFRILVLLLLPIMLRAQSVVVTGKILAADSKTAIAGASVFLSNSSFGTSSAKDGTFTLNGLKPGQYNLVVSAVGYDNYTRVLSVNDAPVNLSIELTARVTQLKEVTISTISKADKKKALDQFTRDFIGTDANAADCEIMNPQVLNLNYAQNKTILEAYTNEFLIVENDALGYRIKFLLKDFKSELLTGNISYSGSQVFEEMKAGSGKQKKWHQKRDEAYFGSAMHFYRSLLKDSLADAGFKIYRLSRQQNTKRPADDEIQRHLDIGKTLSPDSLVYWMQAGHFSRYANQKFKGKFLVKDILQKTAKPGLSAILFPDHLYVEYTKKWETNYYRDLYRTPNDLNYATTIVSLANSGEPIIIDNNGTIIANSPLYEGTWSQARLSVLLPVDYTPYGKQP
jgi:hypothetical protein